MSVYNERGFLGWYQGLTAQVIKAVLCQGILRPGKFPYFMADISIRYTLRIERPIRGVRLGDHDFPCQATSSSRFQIISIR